MSREVLKPDVDALLIDLDGTVYTDSGPVPGASAAIDALRHRGVPFRFITNTTRVTKQILATRLQSYGIEVAAEELFTAVAAGASLLRDLDVETVAPFMVEESLEDLGGFAFSGGVTPLAGTPDAVLVGDLGERWTVKMLNEAFRYVMDGARLVALQKNRYWKTHDGLTMDAGPFVAAIEYATGQVAEVCGKPNRNFYRAARKSLDMAVNGNAQTRVAMIGDDLWGDVKGAQDSNMEGWLVMTGKFDEGELESSGVVPDKIIPSLASLSNLF